MPEHVGKGEGYTGKIQRQAWNSVSGLEALQVSGRACRDHLGADTE